ncbi:hypothetical protein D3C76_1345990 [compost metagenome]
MQLFKRLGIRPAQRPQKPDAVQTEELEAELLAQARRAPGVDDLFYDATRTAPSRAAESS